VSQFEGDGSGNQASGSNPTDAPLPAGTVRVSAEEIDEFLVNSHPEYLTNTIEISAPMLFAMDLSIYSTDDELGFLTSDEPCILHNPTARRYHPMMRSAGLLQRDVQVLLPLSPKLLIAFTHKRTYPFITPIAKDSLDEFNRMMVWHANKEIVWWRGEVREEYHPKIRGVLPYGSSTSFTPRCLICLTNLSSGGELAIPFQEAHSTFALTICFWRTTREQEESSGNH
jgi:hypothetical protein